MVSRDALLAVNFQRCWIANSVIFERSLPGRPAVVKFGDYSLQCRGSRRALLSGPLNLVMRCRIAERSERVMTDGLVHSRFRAAPSWN